MAVLDWLALASASVLVLTWAGYPLAMRLLAVLRRPAPDAKPGASQPSSVSVILATREPPELVRARVENLLAGPAATDQLEVIVAVDHGASWNPQELAMADARVRTVAGDPPGGKAAALNAGVRSATGEFLVFADTAQRFGPETIGRLLAHLQANALGAVSGRLELPAAAGFPLRAYWAMERRLRQDEARVHSAIGVTGAIWAMRRALWQPLPAGLILDDLYTPMRLVLAGHRVGFASGARAHDPRVTTSGDERRRKVRTLVGNFQLCAWLPGVLIPWRNPVWLQFTCHKLLRLLTPWLALPLMAWAVARGGAALLTRGGMPAMVVVASLAAWMLLSPDMHARRFRGLARWAWDLGSAVALATMLGIRGRWEVWHP